MEINAELELRRNVRVRASDVRVTCIGDRSHENG